MLSHKRHCHCEHCAPNRSEKIDAMVKACEQKIAGLTPEEDMMIEEWNKIFNQRNPYNPNRTLSNFDVTGMVKKFIEKVGKKVRIKQKNKPN